MAVGSVSTEAELEGGWSNFSLGSPLIRCVSALPLPQALAVALAAERPPSPGTSCCKYTLAWTAKCARSKWSRDGMGGGASLRAFCFFGGIAVAGWVEAAGRVMREWWKIEQSAGG